MDLKFKNAQSAAAKKLVKTIADDIAPVRIPPDKATIQVADLPFYEEFKFYAFSDTTLPPPNTR
jgi:hypothetical protein